MTALGAPNNDARDDRGRDPGPSPTVIAPVPVDDAACEACLRRSWLIATLAPNIELAWRARRPVRDILALSAADLIAGVGGAARDALSGAHARFDGGPMRTRAAAAGVTAICAHDRRYPPRLRTGPGSPAVVYVAGDVARLERLLGGDVDTGVPAAAVVGTRRASAEGLETARALGRGLAVGGVTVVSGLALGIDSAAHAGALEVGGPTVAVLACGPERPYPPSKTQVHRRLVAEQLVLAEMPPGAMPFRWCFPARNRLIAALGRVTIVVEAAERSGSLITADFALGFGREVGSVPGRAGSPRTRGSNGLLKEGATVLLDAEDALDAVVGLQRVRRGARRPMSGLSPPLRRVLDLIAEGRDTLDALALTPAEADAAMLAVNELELLGLVRRGAGGRYAVIPA